MSELPENIPQNGRLPAEDVAKLSTLIRQDDAEKIIRYMLGRMPALCAWIAAGIRRGDHRD